MNPVAVDAERLMGALAEHARVFVAFSGGVDSSVVAAAAQRANDHSLAVTAQSPSVPRWQLAVARRVAKEIGIDHRIVRTAEGDRQDYRRNDRNRCFFCKDTLYETLGRLADGDSALTIVSGTNADDLGDYRPGISAGNRRGVETPLADLGLTKERVRQLAGFFGLSNRDLPASPCLASRVAYGVEVTVERLRRIERAESYLHRLGFTPLRVRLHEGERARIEVEKDSIPRLLDDDRDGRVTQKLLSLGFLEVTIDRQGFRSGSMNQVLSQPTLVRLRAKPQTPSQRTAPGTDPKEGSV